MAQTELGDVIAIKIIEVLLLAMLSALSTVTLIVWSSIRNDLRQTRAYQHNCMMLTFQLLARLHPGSAQIINEAMASYMRAKDNVNGFGPGTGSNGRAYSASAGG